LKIRLPPYNDWEDEEAVFVNKIGFMSDWMRVALPLRKCRPFLFKLSDFSTTLFLIIFCVLFHSDSLASRRQHTSSYCLAFAGPLSSFSWVTSTARLQVVAPEERTATHGLPDMPRARRCGAGATTSKAEDRVKTPSSVTHSDTIIFLILFRVFSCLII
jgi:hypothetical protein